MAKRTRELKPSPSRSPRDRGSTREPPMTVGEFRGFLQLLSQVVPALPELFDWEAAKSSITEVLEVTMTENGATERVATLTGESAVLLRRSKTVDSTPVKMPRSEARDLGWAGRWGKLCMLTHLALRVGERLQHQLGENYALFHELGPRFLLLVESSVRRSAAKALLAPARSTHHEFGSQLEDIADGLGDFTQCFFSGQHPDRCLIGVSWGGSLEKYMSDYDFSRRYLSTGAQEVLDRAQALARVHRLVLSEDLVMVALLRAPELAEWVVRHHLEDVSEKMLVGLVREPKEGDAWLVPTLLYRAGKEAEIRADSFGCRAEEAMRRIEVEHMLSAIRSTLTVRLFESEFEERNCLGMCQ